MLFAGRDLGDGTIREYCIDVTDIQRDARSSDASNPPSALS